MLAKLSIAFFSEFRQIFRGVNALPVGAHGEVEVLYLPRLGKGRRAYGADGVALGHALAHGDGGQLREV